VTKRIVGMHPIEPDKNRPDINVVEFIFLNTRNQMVFISFGCGI